MDEDTKITISFGKTFLLHTVYCLIIIVLGVLLVMAWMKETPAGECDATGGAQLDGQTTPTAGTAPTTPTAPSQPAVKTPEASCDDATKNGDETDVDCGGSCALKCAKGSACSADKDCLSGLYCVNSTCAASKPVVLSGKVELDLESADYQTAPAKLSDNTTYNRVKVTGVKYKITNGQSTEAAGFIVKVFVKNKGNTYCLNQQTPGTCDDPYATFTVGKVASGKSLSQTHTIADDEYTTKMGRFLSEGSGYDPKDSSRDSFSVIMYLYDENGEPIDGKTISDSVVVNP